MNCEKFLCLKTETRDSIVLHTGNRICDFTLKVKVLSKLNCIKKKRTAERQEGSGAFKLLMSGITSDKRACTEHTKIKPNGA